MKRRNYVEFLETLLEKAALGTATKKEMDKVNTLSDNCHKKYFKKGTVHEIKPNVTRSLGAFISSGGKTPFEQLLFELSRTDECAHGSQFDTLLSNSFCTIIGTKKINKVFPADCWSEKVGEKLRPTRYEGLAFSSVERAIGFKTLCDIVNESYFYHIANSHLELFCEGEWEEIEKVVLRDGSVSLNQYELICTLCEQKKIELEIF